MPTTKTWNYKNLKINFNGAAITDLNGDSSITADSEVWEFVEGQNDYVERSLIENHLCTVTHHMQFYPVREPAVQKLQFLYGMNRFLTVLFHQNTRQDIPERLQISIHITRIHLQTSLDIFVETL